MGRVSKGVVCSVKDCNETAVRSILRENFDRSKSGLELKEESRGRVYLCRRHYRVYKKFYRKNVWSLERFAR